MTSIPLKKYKFVFGILLEIPYILRFDDFKENEAVAMKCISKFKGKHYDASNTR